MNKKILLILCCFLFSCSYNNPKSFDRLTEEPVLITIKNNNWNDASIYVFWDGVGNRIGFVLGKTEQIIRTNWKNSNLQLKIDFVGGGELISEIIQVNPGDHIEYVIFPQW